MAVEAAKQWRFADKASSARWPLAAEAEMIEITESAARVIEKQLDEAAEAGRRPAHCRQGRRLLGIQLHVRVGRRRRRTPIEVFEGSNGAKVFIDPRSLKLLDGTVLDFDENNLMATSFTLKNPHAKSTCGCGEIFFGLGP